MNAFQAVQDATLQFKGYKIDSMIIEFEVALAVCVKELSVVLRLTQSRLYDVLSF